MQASLGNGTQGGEPGISPWPWDMVLAQLVFLFLQPPLGYIPFPSLCHSPCRVLEKAIYLEPTGRQVQTSRPPAAPSRSST